MEVGPMLTELTGSGKVVGVKQVKRALAAGSVRRVFLARDADPRLTESVEELCAEKGVETETAPSMRELGRACGISVGAAVAALLR